MPIDNFFSVPFVKFGRNNRARTHKASLDLSEALGSILRRLLCTYSSKSLVVNINFEPETFFLFLAVSYQNTPC